MIDTGSKVPDLSGTTGGEALSLADLRGHWVVVYFYPKDNTPGCTIEAKDFRDLQPEFERRNARILGVSRDSAKSHCNFSDKYQLPFPLVVDADEAWCKAFDVLHEKSMFGKKYMGVVRSTFLIDPKGIVREAWRGVKVRGHAQAVLDAIGD
ncbi:MAG TPA: peroxiredoxin [Rhodanobacteraceae bacterium]|nr:peroxiredoxin [Rhodanobacteraceae bacterium]